MNFSQTNQISQLNLALQNFNSLKVEGIFYFVVDLGIQGKQRWKTDGTAKGTVFVANI
ncbi:hypothetical protein [Pleurocapsa sp. PCC 7319]|uniref:hypothetical protein n=1 Tax=Pleurocapsa sp. PCC 7319 TaxID=118161 RepID=UPI000348B8C4|nr:hypothetical protein [Pleurocapsa sp. PCC 7319]